MASVRNASQTEVESDQVVAVFLDRDGVINRAIVRGGKPFPPHSVAEFELLPRVTEACTLLKDAGFLLVVATNQPDVGRRTLQQETVERMHTKMCEWLPIDHVEVCYDASDPSECRKPKPGMLLNAAQKFSINLSASFMVGDRWRDIDCGHAAGCKTIFIDNGYVEELRILPDYTVASLFEAAEMIRR